MALSPVERADRQQKRLSREMGEAISHGVSSEVENLIEEGLRVEPEHLAESLRKNSLLFESLLPHAVSHGAIGLFLVEKWGFALREANVRSWGAMEWGLDKTNAGEWLVPKRFLERMGLLVEAGLDFSRFEPETTPFYPFLTDLQPHLLGYVESLGVRVWPTPEFKDSLRQAFVIGVSTNGNVPMDSTTAGERSRMCFDWLLSHDVSPVFETRSLAGKALSEFPDMAEFAQPFLAALEAEHVQCKLGQQLPAAGQDPRTKVKL